MADTAESRRRGGWQLAVTAVVALLAFAAAVWYAYDQGVKKGERISPPLIRADKAPTKVRPEEPGGLEVPHQDKLVFETLTPNQPPERVERLLPPPEEPVSRPEPAIPAERGAARPAAAASGAGETKLATLPKPSAETTSASPPDGAAPAETPAPAPPAAPAQTPPAPVATLAPALPAAESAPPARTAASAKFRVQVAAYRDPAAATKGWHRLSKANPTLLGRLTPNVIRVDMGPEKGVFYRLQAGPLNGRAAADALCAKLKIQKVGCLVVEP